ncbi:hypothetical protein CLNEO_00810 [Anaerotignum neopropionicum]|uniref:Tetratricopeptide repeat protein n=1 Tax=Anaerotignum neopropionicum TaxID=36847 RepID=A0A136WHH4_9FIRM|nr:hypothetical protein [Anaerotignum neopropionicum]KXL53985.1 hypothetical protein CLNEO_00810 [Anaerotignum neopropionicum]
MRIIYVLFLLLVLVIFGGGNVLGKNADILYYVVILAIGVGGAYYAFWFKKFAQKVNALLPLIETEPDTYIAETEKLLEGRLPTNIRSMLIMNIAVAYMEKNDFITAKQKLKRINSGALKKANGAVYFLNLAYVLIHLGENESAMEIIKKYKKRILSLPMGGNLPRLIAFVQIFEAMQEGKWAEANEKMKSSKESWPDRVTGVDFSFLEAQLAKHENADKEI